MEKLSIFFLSTVMCGSWLLASAQEPVAVMPQSMGTVSLPLAEYNEQVALTKNLAASLEKSRATADSLSNALDSEKEAHRITMQREVDFKLKVADLATRNNTLRHSCDSLEKVIGSYKAEAAKFDIVRLRYANGRLMLPYDEKKVAEALEMFEEISDPNTKTTYAEIAMCLKDYKASREEVRVLVETLQANLPKSFKIIDPSFKSDRLRQINNTDYARRTQRSKQNNGYTIIWLDSILEALRTRINIADEKHPADFSDLLYELTK